MFATVIGVTVLIFTLSSGIAIADEKKANRAPSAQSVLKAAELNGEVESFQQFKDEGKFGAFTRIIDRDFNNVCYMSLESGIFCLPFDPARVTYQPKQKK